MIVHSRHLETGVAAGATASGYVVAEGQGIVAGFRIPKGFEMEEARVGNWILSGRTVGDDFIFDRPREVFPGMDIAAKMTNTTGKRRTFRVEVFEANVIAIGTCEDCPYLECSHDTRRDCLHPTAPEGLRPVSMLRPPAGCPIREAGAVTLTVLQ